jgi:hypothetical protein
MANLPELGCCYQNIGEVLSFAMAAALIRIKNSAAVCVHSLLAVVAIGAAGRSADHAGRLVIFINMIIYMY